MPTYIDNSILDAVSSCSSEAVLRYVLGLTTRKEAAHLQAGSWGHKAMETWFRGGTKAEAMTVFTDGYRPWIEQAFADGEKVEDRLSYENCAAILEFWFDSHDVTRFPWVVEPDLVEIGFSAPLDDAGEYVLVGRIDLVGTDKRTGDSYIVDHKFPGKVSWYWSRQFRMSSALSGYQWAVQNHLDIGKQVVGSYINAIELSKLPSDPVRKCPKHATAYRECGPLHAQAEILGPFTRTPQQLEEWRKTALGLAKRYESLCDTYPTLKQLDRVRMEGMFNGSCRFCQFYDFCTVGRPREYVDSYLEESRWEPYKHAFGGGE